jgi:hypothetical protein
MVLARYTVRKPMKRWSLRAAYATVTLTALLLTLPWEPASAHVDLRPRLVVQGALTDVRVELPQLRPGEPPSGLEVEGEGIEVSSADLQGTLGSETLWSVRLRATAEPGVVPLVLRAVYDDGQSVEVDQQLTVVPAPEGSSFPWAGVVAGAFLAAAFAAVSLRLARRKA